MWSINSNQVSFRVTDEQKEYLNDLVPDLEKAHGTKIDSAKKFFKLLIDEFGITKDNFENTIIPNEEQEKEIQDLRNYVEMQNKAIAEFEKNPAPLDEGTLQAKNDLINALGYSEPMPDETFYKDLLEVITLETLTPEPVEIEKEVIKEIPIKLEPNQTIVTTTPEQHNHLELIARWRLSVGKDKELSTVETIIKRMVFNEGTLLNYHGFFATGLKDKNLRN